MLATAEIYFLLANNVPRHALYHSKLWRLRPLLLKDILKLPNAWNPGRPFKALLMALPFTDTRTNTAEKKQNSQIPQHFIPIFLYVPHNCSSRANKIVK